MLIDEFEEYCHDNALSLCGMMEQIGVIIPKIQREYAQGRETAHAAAVRRSFLQEIIKRVIKGHDILELDFVFGKVERVKDDYYLLPVDGQQRLTTLLLAHWLLGGSADTWRFRYEARRMATLFVRELLSHAKPSSDYDTPGRWIRRQSWFVPIWAKDPTVSGMLRTLDTFFALLKEEDVDIEGVDKSCLGNVRFYLNLQKSIDSDESYRKMNARGKALSGWENIKVVVEESIAMCRNGLSGSDDPKGFEKIFVQWESNVNGSWAENIENYACSFSKYSFDDEPEEFIGDVERLTNAAFRNLFDLAVFDCLIANLDDYEEYFRACWDMFHDDADLVDDITGGKRKLGYWLFGEGLFENNDFEKFELGTEWKWAEIKRVVIWAYSQSFLHHKASDADYSRVRAVKNIKSPTIITVEVIKMASTLYEYVGSPLFDKTWTHQRNLNQLWLDNSSENVACISDPPLVDLFGGGVTNLDFGLRYWVLSTYNSTMQDIESRFRATQAVDYIDSIGQKNTWSDAVEVDCYNYLKHRKMIYAIMLGDVAELYSGDTSLATKMRYVYLFSKEGIGRDNAEMKCRACKVIAVESRFAFLKGDIRMFFKDDALMQSRIDFVENNFCKKDEPERLEFMRSVFDWFDSMPQDVLQVQPYKSQSCEVLFARAVRSAQYLVALGGRMEGGGNTLDTGRMSWLSHFKELTSSGVVLDERHVALKKGSYAWLCLTTPEGRVKQDAYRLDMSEKECVNRHKLKAPFDLCYCHSATYLPHRDQQLFYKVNDASWWESETPPLYNEIRSGDEMCFMQVDQSASDV